MFTLFERPSEACSYFDPELIFQNRRAALCERFNTVPTKFIGEVFREHPNYYEAFFAIDKAEKTLESATNKPFTKLKHRRSSAVVPGQLMRSLEENGHDFDSLKEEIRVAESRWNKEKGTYWAGPTLS